MGRFEVMPFITLRTKVHQLSPLACGDPLQNPIRCFDQAAACVFRFLRHPSRANAPRPVAKRGNAAGAGVSIGEAGVCVTEADVKSPVVSTNVGENRWATTLEKLGSSNSEIAPFGSGGEKAKLIPSEKGAGFEFK